METIYKFRNTLTLYRDKIDILVAPNQLHEFVRKKHWAFLLYVLFSKGKKVSIHIDFISQEVRL